MTSIRNWLHACAALALAWGMAAVPAAVAAQPLALEDVPVTYLVNRSGFKYVVSGSELTFELHADSACSGVVESEVVTVGDPNLSVEGVSTRGIKGVAAPSGKPIRLHYVMSPTTFAGRLYLRVTGDNVVAYGSDCQPQAASIQEDVADTLESLSCADGEVAKWDDVGGAWECASDALVCENVTALLAGGGAPFTATATCNAGTVLTGGGHSGVGAGDTVLSSQPDGANGWFCSVDQAAAAGSCVARCCAVQ